MVNHNLLQASSWAETPDGDVVPSYTGPNAPIYPNATPKERAQDLNDTHHEITSGTEADLDQPKISAETSPTTDASSTVTIAGIKARLEENGANRPKLNTGYINATKKNWDNRRRVLG